MIASVRSDAEHRQARSPRKSVGVLRLEENEKDAAGEATVKRQRTLSESTPQSNSSVGALLPLRGTEHASDGEGGLYRGNIDVTSSGQAQQLRAEAHRPSTMARIGEWVKLGVPHGVTCAGFCGGRRCKYESGDSWSQHNQAIRGIYSHWITDRVIAIARPNTKMIETNNLLGQFRQNGISTIINLQERGEHAHCGPGLEDSGFTYDPQAFMDADIFFYNFGWRDFGVPSQRQILNMVKVMDFATTKGKVAVHCHAGQGRTGMLIACYLVYGKMLTATEAITLVRRKRPGSIQTPGQVSIILKFAKYIDGLRIVFTGPLGLDPLTASDHLEKEITLLHGWEQREGRSVPKIVECLCSLLAAMVVHQQPTGNPQLSGETEGAQLRQGSHPSSARSRRNSLLRTARRQISSSMSSLSTSDISALGSSPDLQQRNAFDSSSVLPRKLPLLVHESSSSSKIDPSPPHHVSRSLSVPTLTGIDEDDRLLLGGRTTKFLAMGLKRHRPGAANVSPSDQGDVFNTKRDSYTVSHFSRAPHSLLASPRSTAILENDGSMPVGRADQTLEELETNIHGLNLVAAPEDLTRLMPIIFDPAMAGQRASTNIRKQTTSRRFSLADSQTEHISFPFPKSFLPMRRFSEGSVSWPVTNLIPSERQRHTLLTASVTTSKLPDIGQPSIRGSSIVAGAKRTSSLRRQSLWEVDASAVPLSEETTSAHDRVLRSMATQLLKGEFQRRVSLLLHQINKGNSWNYLEKEREPAILFSMLLLWLNSLKEPVLSGWLQQEDHVVQIIGVPQLEKTCGKTNANIVAAIVRLLKKLLNGTPAELLQSAVDVMIRLASALSHVCCQKPSLAENGQSEQQRERLSVSNSLPAQNSPDRGGHHRLSVLTAVVNDRQTNQAFHLLYVLASLS